MGTILEEFHLDLKVRKEVRRTPYRCMQYLVDAHAAQGVGGLRESLPRNPFLTQIQTLPIGQIDSNHAKRSRNDQDGLNCVESDCRTGHEDVRGPSDEVNVSVAGEHTSPRGTARKRDYRCHYGLVDHGICQCDGTQCRDVCRQRGRRSSDFGEWVKAESMERQSRYGNTNRVLGCVDHPFASLPTVDDLCDARTECRANDRPWPRQQRHGNENRRTGWGNHVLSANLEVHNTATRYRDEPGNDDWMKNGHRPGEVEPSPHQTRRAHQYDETDEKA